MEMPTDNSFGMNAIAEDETGFKMSGDSHIDQADAFMQGMVVVTAQDLSHGACLVIYRTADAADKLPTLIQTTPFPWI
jgi:hypothetical protein